MEPSLRTGISWLGRILCVSLMLPRCSGLARTLWRLRRFLVTPTRISLLASWIGARFRPTRAPGWGVSDTVALRFGVRDVQSTLTPQGYRQFIVNGVPTLLRGGGWASDLFLRTDVGRIRDQLRYVKDMGLNMVRLEGKEENDELF